MGGDDTTEEQLDADNEVEEDMLKTLDPDDAPRLTLASARPRVRADALRIPETSPAQQGGSNSHAAVEKRDVANE